MISGEKSFLLDMARGLMPLCPDERDASIPDRTRRGGLRKSVKKLQA